MADSRLRKLPLQLVFVTLSCSQLVNKPSLQEVRSQLREREFPDYLKWMKFWDHFKELESQYRLKDLQFRDYTK